MSKPSPILGRDLGLAICKHFGIDITNHAVDSNFNLSTEPGKPATVTLTFMLTAEDLAGIARAAGADAVQTFTASGDFIKPSPVATISLDTKASETLRRYGAFPKADHEAETLKTLKDQQEELAKIRILLYEIAKNTKRSACLAEDAAATSEANVQTVLRD